MMQVFITAPNPASGPIPKDVAGTFDGPYYEWFTTEKAQARAHLLVVACSAVRAAGIALDAWHWQQQR
jgi:hypothetical protein